MYTLAIWAGKRHPKETSRQSRISENLIWKWSEQRTALQASCLDERSFAPSRFPASPLLPRIPPTPSHPPRTLLR